MSQPDTLTGDEMIHADIGRQGETVRILCGQKVKKGDGFTYSRESSLSLNTINERVNCPRCKTTAKMYAAGFTLTAARRLARLEAQLEKLPG